MKLSRRELALANGTPSDSCRPVLNNVCLRKGVLTAADGYMIVSTMATLEENDNIPRDQDTLLPASMLKKVKVPDRGHAILEKTADGDFFISTYVKPKVDQPAVLKDPKEIYHTQKSGGTYPDFEKIFPRGEKKAEFAIHSELLRKMLTCLPKNCVLRFGAQRPDQPIEIVVTREESPDTDIRAILMPMFIKTPTVWGVNDPRWVAPVKEVPLADALDYLTKKEMKPRVLSHVRYGSTNVTQCGGGITSGTLIAIVESECTCPVCKGMITPK